MKSMIRLLAGCCWMVTLNPCMALELPSDVLNRLASEQFAVREKAQLELLDWARGHRDDAMDELFRQSRQADEPEVRQRCVAVLKELVNDEYLKTGQGYVGILMQDDLAQIKGEDKPRHVIRVGMIVPGTAGEKAGLQVNDVITGVNGQIWKDGPASLSFGNQIKGMKPGTKITLQLLKGEQIKNLEVTLSKRPVAIENNPFMDPTVDLSALEAAAKEEFFRQWMQSRKTKPSTKKP